MKWLKYMVTALLLALAWTMSGCASDGFNPISGQTTQPGTYAYQIGPDGSVTVNASTLRGGPDVVVETPEGSIVEIKPSRDEILSDILDTLK